MVRGRAPEECLRTCKVNLRCAALLGHWRRYDADGKGRLSGAVYISDPGHWDFVASAMRPYLVSNPLHIEEFFPVCQMVSAQKLLPPSPSWSTAFLNL